MTLSLGAGSSSKKVSLEPLQTRALCTFATISTDAATSPSGKQGYLVNASQPIWALDFLPQAPSSLKSSQKQYIAISGHPSFTPQTRLYVKQPEPSVIQVWSLNTRGKAATTCELSILICHEWGTCWDLKFCPYGAYGNGRVGLLAGVFSDGKVHVIDIREEWLNSTTTEHVRVSQAAWEYSFGEEYIATSLAWKSHTELLVGGSNGISLFSANAGYVALYDLSDASEDSMCQRKNLTKGTIPTFYHFVIDAYILNITSLAPLHPSLIVIAAFDGSVQTIDLRNPYSNTAQSHRQRTFGSFVSPLHFWGGILSPDDVCGIFFSTLRPTKRGLILSSHNSAVWDVATSVGGPGSGLHPFVLTAGSDGVCSLVSSTNRIHFGSKVLPQYMELMKRLGRKFLFKLEKDGGGIKMLDNFEMEVCLPRSC
jgi:hypothetical protein